MYIYISAPRRPLNELHCPETGKCGAEAARSAHVKNLADLASNHHPALLRFLTARTGSREDARDVAQDAYAKILALSSPESVDRLAGYLWKTAGNLAAERRRTRTTRARLDVVALFDFDERAPSAEALASMEESISSLQKAIDSLPSRHAEAFMLRVIEERSYKEVAECMNVSVRWAMEYVARALKHCHAYLDDAGADARASA